MLFKENHKIDLFTCILFFFFALYIFNIFIIHQNFDKLISVKILLLNYDGGFIRRGLLGEFITKISLFFDLSLKNVFFLLHIINYSIFFLLNYLFFKRFKKNYVFYFFVFSPIYLTFTLGDVSSPYAEFLIQRESYLITFFLFFCYLVVQSNKRMTTYFIGLIGIIIMSFLYELTIFTYPFFFTAYYYFLKRNNFKINLFETVFAFFICILIIFLHIGQYGNNDLLLVIENLNNNFNLNYSENDFMYSWINRGITQQVNDIFVNVEFRYILRYFFYAHPVFLIFYIIAKNYNDKNTVYLTCISILSFLLIFAIAIDWARFLHILYFFVLFLSLLQIKNKNIFFMIAKNDFLSKFNKVTLNLLVFFYCTMWTLKHTYWQNHLSYGIFKILKKNLLYLY